jgi:hypothetical protein
VSLRGTKYIPESAFLQAETVNIIKPAHLANILKEYANEKEGI